METSELLKKVRKIEIKTRGLSKHIFAGEYHSAFKGKGMAFSEVREYQFGDDIRSIDWNVTARFNHPYIKTFEEERELTVMLLIDVSASEAFGTQTMQKRDLITEIAAVLSFSAISNNDKIGMIFFSDQIEKFIPPKKGRKHVLRIIRELVDFTPSNNNTNISEGLRYLTNAVKKRCIAFLLSDFMDTRFETALRIANYKHDLVAMHIFDQREKELPNIGMMKLQDAESGKTLWIDTSDQITRKLYEKKWRDSMQQLKSVWMKAGVDFAQFSTGEDYIKTLMQFFKHR